MNAGKGSLACKDYTCSVFRVRLKKRIVGVDDSEGPPVPIPNTEVKLTGGEDTWLETARENSKMPTFTFLPYSI